jgi:alkanesulfonate monooxygenase SsuD/methylene tetrahydromethanopterin reductase-like flavin-dependent oxidoreductase (luciferase family)
MQAGSSDRGRDFAARWAEAIFTIQRGEAEMREFYDDIKARLVQRGRAPHECAILPAVSVVLGETDSIARERAAYLNSLIDPELSLAASSSNLGADLTKLDTGKTLTELQGNQGMQGSADVLAQTMKAEGLTFRQAAVKRTEGKEIVGTAAMVADRLQAIFESGVCDGFVLTPTMFPGMFEQFCRSVVPELQRRGIFRTDYTGRTLRENLQGPPA